MIQVTEINTLRRTTAGYPRLLWNSLLLRGRDGANFFQTCHDWLETYWRHHGDAQRLRVLIVSAASRQIGVLPAYGRDRIDAPRASSRAHISARRLGNIFRPDRPQPRGDVDRRPASHRQHAARLGSARSCPAGSMPTGSTPGDLLTAACEPSASTRGRRRSSKPLKSNSLAINGRAISPVAMQKWRSRTIRRTERRLQRSVAGDYRVHPVAIVRLAVATARLIPRWDLYDACETEIARNSWQGAATDGTSCSADESMRRYLRAAHHTAAEAGGPRPEICSWSAASRRRLALPYHHLHAGSAYGLLRPAYDPAVAGEGRWHSAYSPG